VSVDIDGKTWPGVANIGVRPTVQVMARPTWKFIFWILPAICMTGV
jgi:FAD synthase